MASNGSKYPQIHDESWLRRQIQEGKTPRQIAADVGCGAAAVNYHLRQFEIRTDGRWPQSSRKPKFCERCGREFVPRGPSARFCSPACRAGTKDCEWCGETFQVPQAKRATDGLSKKRFCTRKCLYDWRAANITREPTNYIGVTEGGYAVINLGRNRTKNGGRMLVHRYVMEQHLGRKLLPDENVHHKNGDKLDNRLENLELWIKKQPSGQRPEDLLAWADEIIARYRAESHLL